MTGQDAMIADLQERAGVRRQRMRTRRKARMRRLIAEITQFGRDDAECGSWHPDDFTVFRSLKTEKRRKFEAKLIQLAKEKPDGI